MTAPGTTLSSTAGDGDPCGCPGREFTRRTVLRGAGIAGLTGLLSSGLSTQLAFASGPTTGNDVLVVLSLRGGFDGLSAIAPIGDPGYAAARPTLAVPENRALKLDDTFGLHPSLAPLKPFWDAGTFGAVQAVGHPDRSRSHFAAMEELERAAPGTSLRTGWLDRVIGLAGNGSPLQAVTVGSGTSALALAGPAPDVAMRSLDDFSMDTDNLAHRKRLTALRAMHAGRPGAAGIALTALDRAAEVRSSTPAGTGYPTSGEGQELGSALRDLARIIKTPGSTLQAACVDFGDWDMHENLGTVDQGRMTRQLAGLGAALAAFATDLGPHHLSRVCLVTLSEFGRRVQQNGSAGTDHGSANTVLLLGGGVIGGKVHGVWPGLAPSALDRGDLANRTDYRDVLGELLRVRCGVPNLSSVFPGFQPNPIGVARP